MQLWLDILSGILELPPQVTFQNPAVRSDKCLVFRSYSLT